MDLADKRCFAAVDIGASSGRVLLGWLDGGEMRLEEVHRFVNGQRRVGGHDCWDVEALADEVIAGLRSCNATAGAAPLSIGIDTWGCDFVLLDGEGKLVGDAVAYRDARTQGVPELVDIAVPSRELYRRTGIQRQSFNTIYQLVALGHEHPEQLERAKRLLTIPDYLNWR
ncbi:MAG: FGGY family carbohydrate kinase, partial [Olsenella sp.]